MESFEQGLILTADEQCLIVQSLIFAKKHLSGVLASQSQFDSLLFKFPTIVFD